MQVIPAIFYTKIDSVLQCRSTSALVMWWNLVYKYVLAENINSLFELYCERNTNFSMNGKALLREGSFLLCR